MDRPITLVVIPALNEEERIGEVLREVRSRVRNADILVISDGSTDRTAAIAREMGVTVIDLPFNLGYGAALQTGFRFADRYGYDFVVTMDADGQHRAAMFIGQFKRRRIVGIDDGEALRGAGSPEEPPHEAAGASSAPPSCWAPTRTGFRDWASWTTRWPWPERAGLPGCRFSTPGARTSFSPSRRRGGADA